MNRQRNTRLAEAKARAGKYAALAIGLSFTGNAIHFAITVNWNSVRDIAAVGCEALFGPSLVLITSHLLLHAKQEFTFETAALWAGFTSGAALSAVHLYGIAAIVETGPQIGAGQTHFWPLALLLPLGVEGASIGSIRQYVRVAAELGQEQEQEPVVDTPKVETPDAPKPAAPKPAAPKPALVKPETRPARTGTRVDQVATLARNGRTNTEIATELGISDSSVRKYKSDARKSGINTEPLEAVEAA